MGLWFPASLISKAKRALQFKSLINNKNKQIVAPRGHVAIYVGEVEKKRHVIPISYLSHPLFQDLLSHVEEEYGFIHSMGRLTIPCKEDVYESLIVKIKNKKTVFSSTC